MTARTTSVGTPTTRVDAVAKVTGTAKYSGEIPFDDKAYGSIVQATVARGRVTGFDLDAVTGVLTVLTHENAPALGEADDAENLLLQDDRIRYRGQVVALVVAETSRLPARAPMPCACRTPKSRTTAARSQFLGGITMGIGMALHEESVMDAEFGDYLNHDLAQYHVPVTADVPDIDVAWIDEQDEHLNPLGIKGIGELGIVGAAAAVANAVWHATGVRHRDLPIRPDRVLAAHA